MSAMPDTVSIIPDVAMQSGGPAVGAGTSSIQFTGNSRNCTVPMPSSGSITGMPSSIR